MRISLDARFLALPGIGRHVAGLWRGLMEEGADLLALVNAEPRGWLGGQRLVAPGPARVLAARPFGPASQATLPAVLRREGIEVHHASFLDVPYLSRVPVVLSVYDLFPYRRAAHARSPGAAAYYRAAFPLSVRKAAALVTISEFAARELVEVLGVAERRITVAEPGLDHGRWRPLAEEAIESGLGQLGVTRPYLLYVGTAKGHKNLVTLLAAHRPSMPPLVLAGPTVAELARRRIGPPPPGCRILGRVPDHLLAALYGGAAALALPSLYESVGFTALEAMACGTPVVSSDGGGLADTVGDAGLLVAPTDVGAWSEALEQVCGDGQLAGRLVEAGLARVATRDWRACARTHLGIYRSLAG